MLYPVRSVHVLMIAAATLAAVSADAQTVSPTNSAPNPYRTIEGFGQMPDGRIWGSTAGVDIDRDGSSIWVAERCGAQGFIPPSQMREGEIFNCDGSNLDPILKFDGSGKLVKAFGAGMFVFPHGLHVDFEGNVWVTDGVGRGMKGQTVHKFSPDGKLLMTLGEPGGGVDPKYFFQPNDVIVARNGDIFVSQGHGQGKSEILKFSKDGKLIKRWGQTGSGRGEFDQPHSLAFDSRGRLFVGDRNNNRIQILDQDGNVLDEWAQFSRPSGVFIDKADNLYVADSESGSVARNHPGWKRGIRIGNVKDGKVVAFIPDPDEAATGTSAAEGVAADAQGNVYGAEVGPRTLKRYAKK